MDQIKDAIAEAEGSDEIILDEIEISKITPEIKAEIGNLFLRSCIESQSFRKGSRSHQSFLKLLRIDFIGKLPKSSSP